MRIFPLHLKITNIHILPSRNVLSCHVKNLVALNSNQCPGKQFIPKKSWLNEWAQAVKLSFLSKMTNLKAGIINKN